MVVGILCLIVGLAVYEKFGWAGGIIMGPIETFGLLANTLSYLRVMGVGVAGVKIAEVSISMGWEVMLTQFAAGGIGYLLGRHRAPSLPWHSGLRHRAWPALTEHSRCPSPLRGMDGQIPQRLRGPLHPRGRTKHPCGGGMTVQQGHTG